MKKGLTSLAPCRCFCDNWCPTEELVSNKWCWDTGLTASQSDGRSCRSLYILQTHHNVTYTLNHVNMTVFAAPHTSAWQAQNSEEFRQNLCLKNEVWVQSAVLCLRLSNLTCGPPKKGYTLFKGDDYFRFHRQAIKKPAFWVMGN